MEENRSIYEFDGFGFHFGTYSAYITEKQCGTSVTGLIKRMGVEGGAMEAILQYFFGAAVAYEFMKKSGKDKTLTLGDVAQMIDTVGHLRCIEILNESLGLPKN